MPNLPRKLLNAVSNLSSGRNGSEDADDVNGYLPLPLAARNFPIYVSSPNEKKFNKIFVPCLKIKEIILKEAFLICLDDKVSWEKSLQKYNEKLLFEVEKVFTKENKNFFEPCMTSIALGIASFFEIYNNVDELMKDGPKFYACIDLASQISLLGEQTFIQISRNCIDSVDTEISALLQTVYKCYDDYCNAIKKKVVNVFTHPHLRRSKELLSIYSIYFARMSEDMELIASKSKNSYKKQQRLTAYLEEGPS